MCVCVGVYESVFFNTSKGKVKGKSADRRRGLAAPAATAELGVSKTGLIRLYVRNKLHICSLHNVFFKTNICHLIHSQLISYVIHKAQEKEVSERLLDDFLKHPSRLIVSLMTSL